VTLAKTLGGVDLKLQVECELCPWSVTRALCVQEGCFHRVCTTVADTEPSVIVERSRDFNRTNVEITPGVWQIQQTMLIDLGKFNKQYMLD
jgi:hypothetical protein